MCIRDSVSTVQFCAAGATSSTRASAANVASTSSRLAMQGRVPKDIMAPRAAALDGVQAALSTRG
eukprot:3759321-Lingulodinium_polyedra.AAC.1